MSSAERFNRVRDSIIKRQQRYLEHHVKVVLLVLTQELHEAMALGLEVNSRVCLRLRIPSLPVGPGEGHVDRRGVVRHVVRYLREMGCKVKDHQPAYIHPGHAFTVQLGVASP